MAVIENLEKARSILCWLVSVLHFPTIESGLLLGDGGLKITMYCTTFHTIVALLYN